jgi:hypothetical protein
MKNIMISIDKLDRLINNKLQPESLKFYRVLPNNKADKVNLNKRIIIECMVEDIEMSDPESAFIHIDNI